MLFPEYVYGPEKDLLITVNVSGLLFAHTVFASPSNLYCLRGLSCAKNSQYSTATCLCFLLFFWHRPCQQNPFDSTPQPTTAASQAKASSSSSLSYDSSSRQPVQCLC